MLSYQHAFHAGNHADLIKHLTLIGILEKLCKKPKPFFYLDTHAGAGLYKVDGSIKQDEVLAKSVLNINSTSSLINSYKQCITGFLSQAMYPGSPLIMEKASQSFTANDLQCNAHLNELHPSAYSLLRQATKGKHFHCHQRDAFELLNALMPATPNRGLVLIDPPYEQATEYDDVVIALGKALTKWPQGIFAIWYPLLSPTRIDRKTNQESDTPKSGLSEAMCQEISQLAVNGLLDIRFAPHEPSSDKGMYGSGMLVVNPPWQLDKTIQEALAAMDELCNDTKSLSTVEFLVPLS